MAQVAEDGQLPSIEDMVNAIVRMSVEPFEDGYVEYVGIPHWGREETKRNMGMYNDRTRCIDSIVFLGQNMAISTFVLRPEHFTPVSDDLDEVSVTTGMVEGHMSPEYGISVIRGVDQLELALNKHRSSIPHSPSQAVRVKRIGSTRFSQPVVPGDKMIISPDKIVVDGSTVASILDIEAEIVDSSDPLIIEGSEYAKHILVEQGAQTAVAGFRKRGGDFLVYSGIGPIVWGDEDLHPGQTVEAQFINDPENPLIGDAIFRVDGRVVGRTTGNVCGIGDRERTKELIGKVVQRRRKRATSA